MRIKASPRFLMLCLTVLVNRLVYHVSNFLKAERGLGTNMQFDPPTIWSAILKDPQRQYLTFRDTRFSNPYEPFLHVTSNWKRVTSTFVCNQKQGYMLLV